MELFNLVRIIPNATLASTDPDEVSGESVRFAVYLRWNNTARAHYLVGDVKQTKGRDERRFRIIVVFTWGGEGGGIPFVNMKRPPIPPQYREDDVFRPLA